jgi:hypothetical protein
MVDSAATGGYADASRGAFRGAAGSRPAVKSMAVEDALGNPVHGSVDVSDEEIEWWFTPDDSWAAGAHRLRASPDLEDPAGNGVARVFDAELSMTKQDAPAVRTRGFLISPSGRPTS